MTKTNIFNNIWFKCISVLLAILLVAGGLISILSDVLYVSAEERTKRAIKKIYGTEKEFVTLLSSPTEITKDGEIIGEIQVVYEIDKTSDTNYNLLFKSTGNNGYKNGTVTVWVKVIVSDNERKIDKVILENYEKQTLMSKLTDKFYDNFLIDITDNYETYFTTKNNEEGTRNIVTGATKSATACCNAVNCVIVYLGENNK